MKDCKAFLSASGKGRETGTSGAEHETDVSGNISWLSGQPEVDVPNEVAVAECKRYAYRGILHPISTVNVGSVVEVCVTPTDDLPSHQDSVVDVRVTV